jgi:carbonic anhydrase
MSSRLALSRRHFLRIAGAVAGSGLVSSHLTAEAQTPPSQSFDRSNSEDALRELLAGNSRFADGKSISPRRSPAEFREMATAQFPFAAIVSCADSRVAPEILFDVGKGDIFVVRIAGNVIGGSAVLGSIEYAVAELNVPLILVLGHSNCGAVKAAKAHLDAKDSLPGEINDLVEFIKPAVTKSKDEKGDPLENAIRSNVRVGVERLNRLEPIVSPKLKDGKLKIAGGVYDLRSGRVNILA